MSVLRCRVAVGLMLDWYSKVELWPGGDVEFVKVFAWLKARVDNEDADEALKKYRAHIKDCTECRMEE